MKAVQVTCPNCGARLQVGEVDTVVQCEYCGTASRVQRRTRFLERALPPPVSGPPPIAVQAHNPTQMFVTIGIMAGLLVAGALAATMAVRRETSRGSVVVAPSPPPAVAALAKPSWMGFVPLVADIDGDGTLDVIGRGRRFQPSDQVSLVAIDGATGTQRWESEALGSYSDTHQGKLALAGDTLVFATPRGELRTFSLVSGTAGWRRQLDERIEQLCAGPDDATLRVIGKDAIVRVVRRADGEVTVEPAGERSRARGSRRPSCTELPDDARRSPHVGFHDRGDVELDVERRYDGPRGAVLAGCRKVGTRAPMIAVLDGADKVRWSVVVTEDPLGSLEQAPTMVVPFEEAVCASYYGESVAGASHVACFAMADGARLWSRKGGTYMSLLGAVGPALAVYDGRSLELVDARTGTTRWTFP